ncbi:MAG: AAA family ATPase [Pirellulaceae bacterium]
MKIRTIDIDGFGVWNGLKIDELADTTTVVYGPNEAGKTTLMQFVRAVLYGFTADRRKKYLPPVNGGRPGGRLLLADAVGQFLAHRSAELTDLPDDSGSLSLVDDRGEQRDAAKLDDLLAGVDEPTYNNVFAIGLKEIQELGSLDETAAADYLYKLTSGLDRVSLIDVLRDTAAARTRLLAEAEDEPSRIPDLLARRHELKAELKRHTAARNRWCDVATLRQTLAEEAAGLEKQIAEIEAGANVLRAALDVQTVWNQRADFLRQLDLLKDIRPLPDKAVELLEACLKRIDQCRIRLKKLVAHRNDYRKDLASLEVNRLLLSHAARIEALHDQSQWIMSLDDGLAKLRDEVKRLDGEIEAAVNGFSKSAGAGSLDELPRETMAVLRRPSQAIREENEKLEKAKHEVAESKRELDHAAQQYETVGRARQLPDLNQAIQEAGHKVSLLRRRIQVEERIDQLDRRRTELEFDSDELHTFDETPVRITALVGAFFSIGVALVLFGAIGGTNNWVTSGWPWAMFGFVMAGMAVGGKLLLERTSEESITDNHRHLEQHRLQLAEAKRERDEIDVELPVSNGSLDARMREAEIELRDLERLIPVRTERESTEQRHQAAERRLVAAQEGVKEARHRWRNALRSVGLPEDFAPMKVKQVVKSNAGVLELRRRRDMRKDELDQREREMLLLKNRIQQIGDDVHLPSAADKPVVKVRELIQALTKEKETLEVRTAVEKKLRRLTKERNRTVALSRRADRRYQALLALAGVNDDKGFRKAAADCERAADLKRQQVELTARILQQLAGQFKEEAVAEVFHREGRDIRPRWDDRQKQLAEIRAGLAHLHERRGACTHEMQSLAADKQLGHTLQEVKQAERELADSIRRWKLLTVIGQVLEVVRKRYETDRQPQTLREASEYLHRLTDGHYRRVWMPLDHRNLRIENDRGDSLPLDVLSRGTREAVFIALRLALVTSFARRGTTLPLVLDDVLVNFDSGRVRLAAEVLCDFARTGHQIIMFTCHEHITEIFEEAKADIRLLPHRGEEVDPRPVKRRRRPVQELPPPPPPPIAPDPAAPLRAAVDPNPLFLQAAAEEQWYDEVLDLPPKELPAPPPPKEKKRKVTPRYKIVPREWDRDFWPLAEVPSPPPPELDLPDAWPLAVVPPAPARPVAPAATPKRPIVAPAQPTPPPPKLLTARPARHRFTWESPEMYWEEDA